MFKALIPLALTVSLPLLLSPPSIPFATTLDIETCVPNSYHNDPSYVQAVNSLQTPFIEVAKKAKKTVVQLQVELSSGCGGFQQGWPYNDEFFNQFFGQPIPRDPQRPPMSLGSGFFVSSDGYIMTNYHVVKNAKAIRVRFLNEEPEMEAEFIAGDPSTDVALLKVQASNHEYLEFCPDSCIEVGQRVIAAGNPFELTGTITQGIISAKNRNNQNIAHIGDFIQTDAPVNPGSSGGPLLNLYGQVVGMNTAILSSSGGYMGVSFAIPSSLCVNIMNQLKTNGQVRRGGLGVEVQGLDENTKDSFGVPYGALITKVLPDSPAAQSGLQQGDVIISINGHSIQTPSDLASRVQMYPPGTTISIVFMRNGQQMTTEAILTDMNKSEAGEYHDIYYGITVKKATPSELQKYNHHITDMDAIIIVKIDDHSPLKGKAKEGFVITQVNNSPVPSIEDYQNAIKQGANNSKPTIFLFLIPPKGQYAFVAVPNKYPGKKP